MRLLTTEHCSDGPIRHGDALTACAISGANVLRDVREAITNTFGGQMRRYEEVLDRTLERAMATLGQKAAAKGYDGVVAIKISHPVIVDGAIEVVVSGTGFWFDGDGRLS
ncbi:MAG: heavy metal-binding domain-containing protein [Pseudomonadota bacterium]